MAAEPTLQRQHESARAWQYLQLELMGACEHDRLRIEHIIRAVLACDRAAENPVPSLWSALMLGEPRAEFRHRPRSAGKRRLRPRSRRLVLGAACERTLQPEPGFITLQNNLPIATWSIRVSPFPRESDTLYFCRVQCEQGCQRTTPRGSSARQSPRRSSDRNQIACQKAFAGRGSPLTRPLSWAARLQALERPALLPDPQTGSDCRQGRAR
jgi:hypothetical protein